VLSVNDPLLNFTLACLYLSELLIDLLQLSIQFPGLGALLLLVLPDSLSNALCDPSGLFLGLSGALRATGNAHGFFLIRV